jgi:hypothetical protein
MVAQEIILFYWQPHLAQQRETSLLQAAGVVATSKLMA